MSDALYYDDPAYQEARSRLARGLSVQNAQMTPSYGDQPPEPVNPTSPTDPNASAPVNMHRHTAEMPPQQPIAPPLMPAPPNLAVPPQSAQYGLDPGQQFQSSLNVFKNPMVWLGILGSLATRTPMLAAMGFATGAMDGYRNNQIETFNQNKARFDEALKAANEQNRVELEKYKIFWDRMQEEGWAKTEPEMRQWAIENNDKPMLSLINAGLPQEAFRLYEQRAAQATKLQDALVLKAAEARIPKPNDPKWLASPDGQAWIKQQPKDQQQQYQDFSQQFGGGLPKLEPGQPPPGMTQEQFDINADYYRKTGKLPQLGWGAQMNAQKLAIVNHATDREARGAPISPAANRLASQQAGYQGQISGARAGGTRAVNIEMAANLATMAIPQALQASKDFPRGRWVPVNKAKLMAYEAGSNVSLSKWDIANLQIVEMYARALNPQGQTIRHDMFDRAATVISQAKSPEAYEQILRSIYDAMLRERQGIGATQREITSGEQGTLPSPFDTQEEIQPGEVDDGYRYKGGPKGDPGSWEKVE